MKWFKHEVSARNDERIAHLEQLSGLEGYGFYFKLLEVVAESMDGSNKCSVSYALPKWSHMLYIHHNKFSKLLSHCEVAGLVTVKYHESNTIGKKLVMIEVIIPNLLKYRDNHTKNLQAAYKQELELDKELELEQELYKEKTKEPKKPVAKTTFLLPDWINKTHWDAWHKHPKRKNLSDEQKQLAVNQLAEWRDAGIDYALSLKNSATNNWQGLFEPSQKSSQAQYQTKAERITANNKKAGDEFLNESSEKVIEGEIIDA